jgi:phospholipid/cholesterol/gamma-HCH transport system permease protein
MHLYMQKCYEAITFRDFAVGTGKTFVFGLFIALISCWHGLRTAKGTSGVGYATTRSVVLSCIFIVISDFFLTKMFWVFKW